MKKMILVLVGIGFLVACSGKESPQKETSATPVQSACQINGHDCWDVVQLVKQTKTIQTEDTTPHPHEPWPHYTYTYENPALQNWGITVTDYDMFKDGGSTIYILNDSIAVHTNRKIGSPRAQMGAVTVRFRNNPKSDNPEFDGPTFKYTPQGHLIHN